MPTITIGPGITLGVAGLTFQTLDPYFKYVTMLLKVVGANGAQNNTFTDSSTNNFSITRNGNTTQGTFSPYGDNWSNYFNGTTDYLTFPSNSAYSFGTGDFTVEAWVHTGAPPGGGSTNDKAVFGGFSAFSPACFFFLVNNSNAPAIWNGTNQFTSSLSVAPNTWVHVAWVRASGTLYIFVNGQIGLTQASFTTSFTSAATAFTGRSDANATRWFPGYISNLRVVKGAAVYTSAFTPPTTPLTAISGTSLLTCQSNRFRDTSTNNFAITVTGTPSVQRWSPFSPAAAYSAGVTGGSAYFDGSGDSLVPPQSSVFNLSSGNWTIEAWFYNFTFNGGNARYIVVAPSSGSVYGIIASGTSNGFSLNLFGSGNTLSSSVTPTLNAWQHVAMVKNGSTTSVYVNGVSIMTGTVSWVNANTTIFFGSNTGSFADQYNGYISSARVVMGTAVYTSNFTPPAAPLTAITNTSLLLNMTNAGITDTAMINDLETIGTAQINTSVKKYGTGSMSFDGSTGNLTALYSPNYVFGTGDFTVEGWFYFNDINASLRGIVTLGDGGNAVGSPVYHSWSLRYAGSEGSNQLQFSRYDGTDTTFQTTGVSLTASTWYHIAVCRAAGMLRIFVNGVAYYSAANSVNYSAVNTNPLRVGLQYYGPQSGYGGPRYWSGYIDDLRITRGYARYTSNFTPPGAALSDQ